MPGWLLNVANPTVVALIVLGTVVASVLNKWIEETSKTRRLNICIDDTLPEEREEVIDAYSRVERPHDEDQPRTPPDRRG